MMRAIQFGEASFCESPSQATSARHRRDGQARGADVIPQATRLLHESDQDSSRELDFWIAGGGPVFQAGFNI